MQITVTGKQLDVGDSLRTHVEEALQHIADKYFTQTVDAQVILSKDAYLFTAHITVNTGRNIQLQAEGKSDEAYAAFDLAAGKMQQRLRKYKKRLKDHHTDQAKERQQFESLTAQSYVLNPEKTTENDMDHSSLVVAEMAVQIEHLTVSEAVMRLDLGQLPVLMFRNQAHGGLNLVYRRADGHVGWIDPAANTAALKKSA